MTFLRIVIRSIFCLSMISAQTLRVCREGKPVPTFPDHALDGRQCSTADSALIENRHRGTDRRNGPQEAVGTEDDRAPASGTERGGKASDRHRLRGLHSRRAETALSAADQADRMELRGRYPRRL